MTLIRRGAARPRQWADLVFLDRHILDSEASIRIGLRHAPGIKPRLVRPVNLGSLRLKLFRLVRVQIVHFNRNVAGLVFPIDLHHAELEKQRLLDPIVQQQKAVALLLKDIVDEVRGLACELLVLRLYRIERGDMLGGYERLQHRCDGIIHRDRNG